jgi:hypothetical protein
MRFLAYAQSLRRGNVSLQLDETGRKSTSDRRQISDRSHQWSISSEVQQDRAPIMLEAIVVSALRRTLSRQVWLQVDSRGPP